MLLNLTNWQKYLIGVRVLPSPIVCGVAWSQAHFDSFFVDNKLCNVFNFLTAVSSQSLGKKWTMSWESDGIILVYNDSPAFSGYIPEALYRTWKNLIWDGIDSEEWGEQSGLIMLANDTGSR